jgi:hypothetical protein
MILKTIPASDSVRDEVGSSRTCRISVESGEAMKAQADSSPLKEKALLNKKMELIYDPVSLDLKTRTAIFPVRLKNISHESLYGPFSVKVKALFPEYYKKYYSKKDLAGMIPEILNASNKEKGANASFDYSGALRDLTVLEPGALTEPVEWKVRFPNVLKADLNLEVEITGFVAQKREGL